MTTLDILTLISAPTITGIVAIIITLLNRRKIKELHVMINSNLTKWIAASVSNALAKGVAKGVEQERVRTENLTPTPTT